MNVLFLTNHLNVGGITSYILTLAGGLKKRGHRVFVASSGGDRLDHLRQAGIGHLPIPIRTKAAVDPRILVSALILAPYLDEHKIDILHANTRVTQVLASLLHKISRRPYVSTCHGFFKPRLTRKVFACWGKLVIAISQQVKEHLVRDFGLPDAGIRIIHNGIDIQRFQPRMPKAEVKEKFGLGPGPLIGIIARLSDVKGHRYLIQAMPQVLKKTPSAQLFIVGEGREERCLRKLCCHVGVDGHVLFIPSVQDTTEALSAMDVFVMPSLQEGLGLSIMEAMAAGVPVVASQVGGITTLIRNNETGLLVAPKDSSALAQAIIGLLEDREKANDVSFKARAFIDKHFSQEGMVLKTEQVYRVCLDAKK